jgi:hypothetical protein
LVACAGLSGPQYFQRTPSQRIQQFCHCIFAPILFSPVYVQCILTGVELSSEFQETVQHHSDTAKQPRIILQHFKGQPFLLRLSAINVWHHHSKIFKRYELFHSHSRASRQHVLHSRFSRWPLRPPLSPPCTIQPSFVFVIIRPKGSGSTTSLATKAFDYLGRSKLSA